MGGEAAGLYAGCAPGPVEDDGRYPGVEERGGGTLFFLWPPPIETGEPDCEGSMDMRSMRSFRRCCSWSAP